MVRGVSILSAWRIRAFYFYRNVALLPNSLVTGRQSLWGKYCREEGYRVKKVFHFMLHPADCLSAQGYDQRATRIACLVRTQHEWFYTEHYYKDCPWHKWEV